MKPSLSVMTFALAAFCVGAEPASAGGDEARGQVLFKRNCAGCHGQDGRGGAHTFMPHVDTLTKKGYIDELPDEHLAFIIAEGGQAVGKSSYMPAWKSKLSDKDINDIVAFIRTLPLY